jgi:molybdopterin converting factor small subunit
MITIRIQYYALLREQAGRSRDTVSTLAVDAASLYDELRAAHHFTLAQSQLRVAIDGEFADWSTPLKDGAEVVFIPPVAGG